jgi:hypothetical protein
VGLSIYGSVTSSVTGSNCFFVVDGAGPVDLANPLLASLRFGAQGSQFCAWVRCGRSGQHRQ